MINSKLRWMFACSEWELGKGQESQEDMRGFKDSDFTLFLKLWDGSKGISLLFFYVKCTYMLCTFFWFLGIFHTYKETYTTQGICRIK